VTIETATYLDVMPFSFDIVSDTRQQSIRLPSPTLLGHRRFQPRINRTSVNWGHRDDTVMVDVASCNLRLDVSAATVFVSRICAMAHR